MVASSLLNEDFVVYLYMGFLKNSKLMLKNHFHDPNISVCARAHVCMCVCESV